MATQTLERDSVNLYELQKSYGLKMSEAMEAEQDAALTHVTHALECKECTKLLAKAAKWKRRAKKAEAELAERDDLDHYKAWQLGLRKTAEARARDEALMNAAFTEAWPDRQDAGTAWAANSVHFG